MTCSVAGTSVTLKTSAADCAEVCPSAVKECCAAAPLSVVPFRVSVIRLLSGYDAPVCGAAVPLYEA